MGFHSRIKFTVLLFACLFISACKSPEEKHDRYIQKGDSFYDQKDYVRARLEYKNAAQILPTSHEAIYKLGQIEEAEGHYQSALAAYLVSEQQNADFVPTLLKLAQFFLIAQQSEAAQERIQKILSMAPEHATAHALKASLFLKERLLNQAQEAVETAFKHDPSNLVAFSVQAGIYLEQEQYEQAVSTLNEGIKHNRQESSLYLLKATAYSQQDDKDGVSKSYHELFKAFPDKIEYRFDLARIMIEFSESETAKSIYKNAVELFPDSADAKQQLIKYLEQEKGLDSAKAEVQSFIKQTPDQKIFHLWLADIYARNNEHENAISTLQKVIDTNPNDWLGLNAQTTLAQIELSRGDLEMASNLVSLVLKEEVNNNQALLLRANLSFIQGDHRKAISDLRTILNNNPGALKASRVLAEALLVQGRNDLAIDTLIQAIEKTPDDPGTLVRLAQLYALRGERNSALDILDKVTESFPSYSIAWESIARIALEGGKISIAENAVKELQKSEGQDTLAQFLLARIDQKNDRIDQASKALEDIIRADINSPIATYALATLLEMAQEQNQVDHIGSILKDIESHTFTSLTVLGAIEMQTNRIEEAEHSFRQAIALKPSNQDAYISLSRILLHQSKVENALDILSAAEKAVPSVLDASMLKANIFIQTGKYDEAINIYERVLKRNDAHDAAANNIALIIADQKYTDTALLRKARLLAERFINSENPNHLDTLGWVYYRSDLPIQAQPILEKAIKLLNAPHPQIDYHYGAVLKENGHLEKAKHHLQRATNTTVAYTGLDEAKAMLKALK